MYEFLFGGDWRFINPITVRVGGDIIIKKRCGTAVKNNVKRRQIMKKMKISRDVRIVLFTLIFVFSIMVTFFIAKNIFVGSENKPSGQTIKHTLENISILNAAEYHYTHVEPYDSGNRKIFWNVLK